MKLPAIFKIEEDKLAVIGVDFIGINIEQDEVDDFSEKISLGEEVQLQTTNGKVISYKNIDEIVSKEKDTSIDIGSRNKEGYSIETIKLLTLEERDSCIQLIHKQLGSNFSYNIQPQKLFDALLLPGIAFLVCSIGGGLLTWFCQVMQEPLQRTHVVKSSVYLAYKICSFIGPTIPMVLSILLSIISLFFVIRQFFNRPTIILIEKAEK